MTKIYVLSCKGNIVDIIHRKHFDKKYGEWVPYSTSHDARNSKRYPVRDMRGTNLNAFAIYPWGASCKKRR